MPFEDELAAGLRQVGAGFRTEAGPLVVAGLARGRRLRRRRRVAMSASVVGLAAVGVAVTLLVGAPGSGTDSPSASQPPVSPGPAGGKYSGKQVASMLERLLPSGGQVSGVQAHGTGLSADGIGPAPYASLVYDDGHGGGAVSLTVGRVASGDPGEGGERSCPDPGLVPGSCSAAALPGGGTLVLLKGYEYPDRQNSTKRWAATATYPDGRQVSVTEWNAPAEKGAPATRPQPPLPASRLRSIATAPVWAKVAADLPTPSQVKDGAAGPRPAALATMLGKLLPSPVTVRKAGPGHRGFAAVAVDDGRGACLLEITVQNPAVTRKLGVASRFTGAEVLGDGTKVLTARSTTAGGAQRWSADVLRPDGRRILIREYNGPARDGRATRAKPALSAAQLRSLATAGQWGTLNGS